MTTILPEALTAFFRAKNYHDVNAMLETFTPDAVVHDEGESRELRGVEQIKAWLEGTVAAYKLSVEVTGAVEQEGEIVVTTLVSGDFPGSPIEFYYHTRLKDGKIAEMAIR